jgi:outer membrane protein assembly factor BamB
MELLRKYRAAAAVVLIPLLMIAGCSRKYRANDDDLLIPSVWPYYRGDLSSRGAMPDAGFSGNLDIIWEFKSNDKPAGPLTIIHNRLVYPGSRNKIKFIDIVSGEQAGYIKPKGYPQTGLTATGERAFYAIGPRKDLLKCISLAKGKKLWERHLRDAVSGLLIVGDLLVVGSSEGVVLGLNSKDGKEVWSFQAKSRFAAPATYGGGVLYQAGDDGVLYALNPENGNELYRVELKGPLVSPVAVSNLVYLTSMKGYVYGLRPGDGSVVWRQQLNGPIWAAPAVSDHRLFVGHSGGEIVALDAATGQILWTFETVDVVRASPVVAGQYVIAGTMAGKIYSFNVADGTVVQERDLGGPLSTAPVCDGSRVFVADDRGRITCFGSAEFSENAGK